MVQLLLEKDGFVQLFPLLLVQGLLGHLLDDDLLLSGGVNARVASPNEISVQLLKHDVVEKEVF